MTSIPARLAAHVMLFALAQDANNAKDQSAVVETWHIRRHVIRDVQWLLLRAESRFWTVVVKASLAVIRRFP